MTGEAIGQRLPARLDTLGALPLAQTLAGVLAFERGLALDAGDVAEIGIVALQLLATVRGELLRQGRAFGMERVPPAIAERIRDGGLGPELLEETAAIGGEGRLAITFTEAALCFGEEPLDRLAALRALGATIRAIAPGDPAAILANPDRLAIGFTVALPPGVDEAAVATMLGAEEGLCRIVPDSEAPPAAPAPASEPAPGEPAPGDATLGDVPVAQHKLDALVALLGDLIASQAGLNEALGGHRGVLALPLADLDRTVAGLQDGILRIGTSRLDTLLARLPGGAAATLTGGGIEIERALLERIGPALASLLARDGVAITAAEEGGFLLLEIAVPTATPALETLLAQVRRIGGRGEVTGQGRAVELRLPRSLSLIDAMMVEVGSASYAVPVSHLIEVLRPTEAMLHRLDPKRPLLRYRERYLPVIAIGERFGHDGWERDPRAGVLAVVHAGDALVALQADAISDQRQVALKPLGGGLAPPAGIAGAAIMGASRIALVLDLAAFEGFDPVAPSDPRSS